MQSHWRDILEHLKPGRLQGLVVQGQLASGLLNEAYMSPLIRPELLISVAQFQGWSSPQLQREYTIGLPVLLSALDMALYLQNWSTEFLYRSEVKPHLSKEIKGTPDWPWL